MQHMFNAAYLNQLRYHPMFFTLQYKARKLQKGGKRGKKDNASTFWGISYQL